MIRNFRRDLIVGSLIILASLIIFISVLYWLDNRIVFQANRIVADRNLIRKNSQLIEDLAEFKTTLPRIERYQTALDALLPSKDELLNFSGWLDGLARAHQVNIDFSFQGDPVAATTDQPGYINFNLGVSGGYDNLISFLKDLEVKSPKFSVVFDNFDLKRNDSNYNITVHGRTFFR